MLHFHKWETVIKERCTVVRVVFGIKQTCVGLRVLEVCTKCGEIKAWLVDSSGDGSQKLPESVFSDEELELALTKHKG
jgi:hypothetical protein